MESHTASPSILPPSASQMHRIPNSVLLEPAIYQCQLCPTTLFSGHQGLFGLNFLTASSILQNQNHVSTPKPSFKSSGLLPATCLLLGEMTEDTLNQEPGENLQLSVNCMVSSPVRRSGRGLDYHDDRCNLPPGTQQIG